MLQSLHQTLVVLLTAMQISIEFINSILMFSVKSTYEIHSNYTDVKHQQHPISCSDISIYTQILKLA